VGERCDKCNLPIPKDENPFSIPCSEYHIRCPRCGWPVAKNIMGEEKICPTCRGTKR
jgi:hypothetical protein